MQEQFSSVLFVEVQDAGWTDATEYNWMAGMFSSIRTQNSTQDSDHLSKEIPGR